MTLSTDLIVVEPINPERLFLHALALLGREVGFDPTWNHTAAGEGRGFSNAHYVSTCGQGLPAWLWVHYATDGPLRIWDEERLGWEHEDDPGFTPPWFDQHCVRVDVDTAYGYRHSVTQAGCGDLHAWFLTEMVAWLDGQGVTKWVWQNEFTGEYFDTLDDLPGLGDPTLGALRAASDA